MRSSAPILALAALTLLAACNGRHERDQPVNETVAETPVEPAPVEPAPEPVETPPPPADINASEALPPPEEAAPDEQMLDDASATGMTARVSRDDEAPAADEALPAEER